MASDGQRATRMQQLAEELCDCVGRKVVDDVGLEAYDIVSIFAACAALSVARFKSFDREFAEELAGNAIRTLVRNFEMNGIESKL